MPTIIKTTVGGGVGKYGFMFPFGYKVKSTRLGDTFPGFTSNIIPLVMSASTSVSGGISSGTSDISYNNGQVAGSLTGGGGWSEGGSWYSVNSTSTSKSGSGTVVGIYLPYYYDYDYTALFNGVKSGTCLVWLDKSGGIDINPSLSWKFKSTKNGDVFPGFGANVLPITITPQSASGSNSYHNTAHGDSHPSSNTTASASRSINGITALSGSCTTYLSQDMGSCESHYTDINASVTISAKNLFLPYFYNFDWNSIQGDITSGTVVEWFQK